MNQFPGWRYHATLDPVIVNSDEEAATLGEGWADTPAAFDQAEPDQPAKAPRKKPAKE